MPKERNLDRKSVEGTGQIPTPHVDLVFVLAGTTGVIIQSGLLGKLVKTFGDANLVISGTALCAVGLLLILWSGTAVRVILSTILFSIGTSLMGPTSSSLVSKQATNGQGVSLRLFQAFGSLGRIFGLLAGGAMYGVMQGLPYLAGSALLLLMLLIAGRRIYGYSQVTSTERE